MGQPSASSECTMDNDLKAGTLRSVFMQAPKKRRNQNEDEAASQVKAVVFFARHQTSWFVRPLVRWFVHGCLSQCESPERDFPAIARPEPTVLEVSVSAPLRLAEFGPQGPLGQPGGAIARPWRGFAQFGAGTPGAGVQRGAALIAAVIDTVVAVAVAEVEVVVGLPSKNTEPGRPWPRWWALRF